MWTEHETQMKWRESVKGLFIFPMVKIARFSDYCIKHVQHICLRNSRVAPKFVGFFFFLILLFGCWLSGTLSKTAEDEDGNVGKTIRLITQDKKRTWISEIKLTFVPSCSQMRLQLLHFHAVFKTNTHRFVQKETLESTEFQRKRNI